MAMTSPSETIEAFLEAFNSGDVEAILGYYGTDAVFVTEDGQVLQGAESMRQAFAGFMAMKPNLQIDKSRTISAGDVVVNVMKWTMIGNRTRWRRCRDGGERFRRHAERGRRILEDGDRQPLGHRDSRLKQARDTPPRPHRVRQLWGQQQLVGEKVNS